MDDSRFRDDGRQVSDFTDEVLVVCPRCGDRASIRPFDPADGKLRQRSMPALEPRRLVCSHCTYTREHLSARAGFGRPTDPWFGLPLALQAPCAGHTIWAYNRAHAEHLLAWARASIRQRAVPQGQNLSVPTSMVEKMPAWFGQAANRRAVVRALEELVATTE